MDPSAESDGPSPGATPSPMADAGDENPVSENHTTPQSVVHDAAAAASAGGQNLPGPPPPAPDPPQGVRLRMPSGQESEFFKRFLYVEAEYADAESFEVAMMNVAYAIYTQGLQDCLPPWNEWQVIAKEVKSLGHVFDPNAGQSLGDIRHATLAAIFGPDWRKSVGSSKTAAPGVRQSRRRR